MPSLWMLVRASGTVDIVLLTVTVALGVSTIGSGAVGGAPRFFIRHIHRDASLLAVALLIAHVVAAVMLLHLGLIPSLVPFASHTRRLYLGLGVLGADLMVAVAVTSMVRMRLGLRRWRWLHLTAYLAWGAAVVHGAAPGTDVGVPWVADLDIACVLVVMACAIVRLLQLQRHQPLRLLMGGAVAALALIGFVTWVHTGPSTTAPSSGPTAPALAQLDVTEN
jgi:sulfoxide reductase heme-binding subunit YedZ